jgi:hypothetical protein
MQPLTITFIQTIVSFFSLIVILFLQSMILYHLIRIPNYNTDPKLSKVHKFVVLNILLSALVLIILFITGIVGFVNRDPLKEHISWLTYTNLLVSGLVSLFVGGTSGIMAAELYCLSGNTSDPDSGKMGEYAGISAAIGIGNSLLMVFLQTFIHKEKFVGLVTQKQ